MLSLERFTLEWSTSRCVFHLLQGSRGVRSREQGRAPPHAETRSGTSGAGPLPYLWASVPDLEEAVPGPGGHSHPVISHTQAADTVVMPSQDTWSDNSTVAAGAGPGRVCACMRVAPQWPKVSHGHTQACAELSSPETQQLCIGTVQQFCLSRGFLRGPLRRLISPPSKSSGGPGGCAW